MNVLEIDHSRKLFDESERLSIAARSEWLDTLRARSDLPKEVIEHVYERWLIEEPPRRWEAECFAQLTELRLLGWGGFGSVFRAMWHKPEKPARVAVKIHGRACGRWHGSSKEQWQEEFEARIRPGFHAEVARLRDVQSAYVPAIYDFGEWTDLNGDPFVYVIMELVENAHPICDYIRRRRLGFRPCLSLFIEACQALEALHLKGLVHRDVKPANIMVSGINGRAYLIDFGLVAAVRDQIVRDDFRRGAGTDSYLAPEQRGDCDEPIGSWTDIYAMGRTLREAMAGAAPEDECDQTTALVAPGSAIRLGTGDPFAAVPDLYRSAVRALVDECLHRSTGVRIQTAGKLRERLEALRSGVAWTDGLAKLTPVPQDGIHIPRWKPIDPAAASVRLEEPGAIMQARERSFRETGLPSQIDAGLAGQYLLLPPGVVCVAGDDAPGAGSMLGRIERPVFFGRHPVCVGAVRRFVEAAHDRGTDRASLARDRELFRLLDARAGLPDAAPMNGLSLLDWEVIIQWFSSVTSMPLRVPSEIEWVVGRIALEGDAESGSIGSSWEWTRSSWGKITELTFEQRAAPGSGGVVVVRRQLRASPEGPARQTRTAARREKDVCARLVCDIPLKD